MIAMQLIDGVNATSCEELGCGGIIEFEDFDVNSDDKLAPDSLQPTGLKCRACGAWFCTDHSDRENRVCSGCRA